MSSESPLDFFSSSSKKKSKTNKPLKHAAKASGSKEPVTKHSAKSVKELVDSKRKPDPKVAEAKAIIERIDFMNKDLAQKIDAACKMTGKSPEELESFIQSNSELSANDKQIISKMKNDFAQTVKDVTNLEAAAPSSPKTSKKAGKPTGDLRTKSIGAKRKWMPVK